MKDIVKEILSTEKRVEEILQKARAAASDIKLRAEREVSEKVAGARRTAREIIQKAFTDAEREAQKYRDDKLKEAERESREIINRNRKNIEKLIEEIVQLIVHTGFEGKGS